MRGRPGTGIVRPGVQIDPRTTVAQRVVERPARARVFEELAIDYCCGGRRSLEAACVERGLDPAAVVERLEAQDAVEAVSGEPDWARAPLSALCDHIVSVHHAYLRSELPRLASLMTKVAGAHGGELESLYELQAVLAALREELEAHMWKEEDILFPLCVQLEAEEAEAAPGSPIAAPIAVMEHEHDLAAQALARMRELTHGYSQAEARCNTHRALLEALMTLDADLHEHIHEENNILFPRALAAAGHAAQ